MLQECQAEVPNPLRLLLANSFESTDLDGEFRHMGLDSVQHQASSQAPPNKRRKIHAELDLLGEVTAKLYSLPALQDVTDLDGLSQVAE